MSTKTADTRYIVSWVPKSAVVAACRKLGMVAGDGTSFWDWIEPEHCQRAEGKPTFFAAVFTAKTVLKSDVCGEVRIAREVLVHDHDDLGNVFKRTSWEEDAAWHIHDEADAPSEAYPDFRCDELIGAPQVAA